VDVVALLGALAEQGANALLKADGERLLAGERAWTLVVTGGPLGADPVRTDAASVADCLAAVVPALRARGLTVPA
jgi:hypothetical protein